MFVCKALACILVVAGLQCAAFGTERYITLHSKGIAISIDAGSGQITSIKNLHSKETYPVARDAFQLETDRGTISISDIPFKLSSSDNNSCTFTGTASGIEFTRRYSLLTERSYIDRKISIRNTLYTPVVIKTVADCCLEFSKSFDSVVYHDDNMNGAPESGIVYHTSINVFMRGKNGGLFAGIKYPYFKPVMEQDRVSLSYETNYRLKPGEVLDLPDMFCGAYKKTGFTCKKALHWTPRIISTKQEEMDWGEVWAMQKLMADYLPEAPSVFSDHYYLLLNVWWANRNLQGAIGEKEAAAYCDLIDLVKKSRCLDPLLAGAPVWMGWTGFLEPCSVIDAIGDDASFPGNPNIDEVASYAESGGVYMGGFCEPTAECRNYRSDRPDWDVIYPADIKDIRPPWHRAGKCHANDEYENWSYRLLCNTIDKYDCKLWAWDYAWMRYPCLCQAVNHGHEPGNCEFQQFRNVTGVIQRLRERYPKLHLATFWAVKEAGPWALKGINYTENAYENASPSPPGMSPGDDLRFQHWYNHNYRFLPTYMNLAQIYFSQPNGHTYSILSALSASTGATLNDWISFSTDDEADRIFGQLRKWKAWATENKAYLKDRVDLFGQPCRQDGIDGTAHIIGDRGFIFVFNPWPDKHWGSIPLNEMIGLTKGKRFTLSEISTNAPRQLGIYKLGDEYVFSIEPKTAMLIELKTTKETACITTLPAGVRVQNAFSR